jgi:hypothetical protein
MEYFAAIEEKNEGVFTSGYGLNDNIYCKVTT